MVPKVRARLVRRSVFAASMVIFVPSAAHPRDSAAQCPAHVRKVQQLERAWLDAYSRHDPEAMARILGPGFTITYANASVETRDDVIANMRKRRGQRGQRFWTDEVSGRCFGSTVILVGWVHSEKGGRERYTDTYVRDGRDWVVVASHLSATAK